MGTLGLCSCTSLPRVEEASKQIWEFCNPSPLELHCLREYEFLTFFLSLRTDSVCAVSFLLYSYCFWALAFHPPICHNLYTNRELGKWEGSSYYIFYILNLLYLTDFTNARYLVSLASICMEDEMCSVTGSEVVLETKTTHRGWN